MPRPSINIPQHLGAAPEADAGGDAEPLPAGVSREAGGTGAADRALAQAAVLGHRRAIEDLLERMECVPNLLAAQNARMGGPLDEHEMADLVQDTLVVVWSKLAEFEGRGSLEAWVYSISRYQLLRGVRRKIRTPRLLDDMPSLEPPRSAPVQRPAADLQVVYEALDSLRPKEAEVLRGKHIEQWSFDEIARRLNVSANTAKSRYYRGIQKLNEILRQRRAKGGPT